MKSKPTSSKHTESGIGLKLVDCPRRRNTLRNAHVGGASTAESTFIPRAREDVGCATTSTGITTMLLGGRMPKDWLHEAEKHLLSSGVNPDNHIVQAILCLILEIRKRNSVGKRKR